MKGFFKNEKFRGVVGHEVNFEVVKNLGLALTKYRPKPKVVVATDTRPSGAILKHGLFLGLVNGGAEVVDIGVCPTAGVSFLTEVLEADFGVMITASHNPPEYNGIKIFNKFGERLTKSETEAIKLLMQENFVFNYYSKGFVKTDFDAVKLYEEYLENAVEGSLSGLKIVLDTANGAGVKFAPNVFRSLGATVLQIGASDNGLYINEGFGAVHPELLSFEVKNSGADLGLGFDGDADRLVAVTPDGEILDGSQIMYILANYLQKNENLTQVVTTAETNRGIIQSLEVLGVKTEIVAVGEQYVLEKMGEAGIILGAERSGHIILGKYSKTSDGILAGVILASIIKESKQQLGSLSCKNLFFQAERSFAYFSPQKILEENNLVLNAEQSFATKNSENATKEKGLGVQTKHSFLSKNPQNKLEQNEFIFQDKLSPKVCNFEKILERNEVKDLINQISATLGDLGRVLVRKSETEDVIRILVESESQSLANLFADQILSCIKNIAPN